MPRFSLIILFLILDGKNYDRLPVLVTGYNVEQLLGIPRLDSGSRLAPADATYELLDSWGLVNKVVGAVFDTTATNTGCHKGSCKLLEDKNRLGREILWCACRHHVFELVLEAVGTVLLGESNDPRLPFFGKLADNWNKIDKSKIINPAKNDASKFFRYQNLTSNGGISVLKIDGRINVELPLNRHRADGISTVDFEDKYPSIRR